MQLLLCAKDDYKDYLSFVKSVYKDFPNYKDTLSPVLKTFLQKKGSFCRNISTVPIIIKKNNTIVAACIYIISKSYSKVLQVAFFEALENQQEAVDLIIKKAKEICRENDLNKIVIGLNGHVNYGIGFLCDKFEEQLSFGSSFNPTYYVQYFEKYAGEKCKMVSYYGNIAGINFDKEIKILQRINKKFSYRDFNFKAFKSDMKIYTELNNVCFKEHPFYFERTNGEDYELFKELKYFIKEENIIFVEREGTPIGYMLWYPDFNELIGSGETIGIRTYIKNKLYSKKIKRFKIVEIAILPEFQKSGAILGLFNECLKKTKNRYTAYETSWILEKNFKSKNFGVKYAENEYKHYVAYEISLVENTL